MRIYFQLINQMKTIYLLVLLLFTTSVIAQNNFKALVISEKSKEILVGATAVITELNVIVTSNENGEIIFLNIPNGTYKIEVSYLGYDKKEKSFNFPLSDANKIFEFLLEPSNNLLEEVIVPSTTRSSKSIQDIPTRIEVIEGEEIDEKISMKPGDIKMLLNESTGIATQQTSAISGTANIRIQGLDGRYTQILKDGMPLYTGFSGGLSIMQIAPLDLKQVEFIKGSASTLYGGGAISGLVNLISKTPREKREFTTLLNATSAKGLDASTFYSQKYGKIGTTIFASYNYNGAYDPADIGLTAIPKTKRITLNPKVFFYLNEKTKGYFGINLVTENRLGGDLEVINGNTNAINQFFEKNNSFRTSTQLNIEHKISENSKIQFKNSVGFFNRKLIQPTINFKGRQVSTFTEISYSHTNLKSEWVTGINLWTDNFISVNNADFKYKLTTLGGFTQNLYKANSWFSLESGLRIDYNSPTSNDKLKLALLPRINGLFKINDHFSSRIGGGIGYKMPSPFNEEAEARGYQNLQPINFNTTKIEKSYGTNADINFKTRLEEVSLTVNQLFFYTYLQNPIILENNNFVNTNGTIDAKGVETNVKIGFEDFKLFLGYTFTDVKQHFNNESNWQPLTAKHRLNYVLTYEKENDFRMGIEGLLVSNQKLNDGTIGKGYVMYGFLFEKIWEHFNVFINAENFTDRRQTRWDTIYSGPITNPTFKDIYAPTDGIVINIGVKIKL